MPLLLPRGRRPPFGSQDVSLTSLGSASSLFASTHRRPPLIQELQLPLEQALCISGLADQAVQYGNALNEQGYVVLSDLVPDGLTKDELVRCGMKAGHAGRFLTHFGRLNPSRASTQTTDVFVQIKEGLRIRLPSCGFGLNPVTDLDPTMTFDALFDRVVDDNAQLKSLKIGQTHVVVHSFAQQGDDKNPCVHNFSGQLRELGDRKYIRFSVPKITGAATPQKKSTICSWERHGHRMGD